MSEEQTITTNLEFVISANQAKTDLGQIEKHLASIKDSTAKTKRGTDDVVKAFSGFRQAARDLSRMGSGLQQLGQFFGSDQLQRVGQMTSGIGGLVMTLGEMKEVLDAIRKGGGMGKALGFGTSIVGGALLGASIYDATIGKAQNQTAGNILAQTAAAASYNIVKDLTGNAQKANDAFRDTAAMYGLMKSKSEEANDALQANIQAAGGFTMYLMKLEEQLRKTAAAAPVGSFAAAGANIGAIGANLMLTASSFNSPILKAFSDYQKKSTEQEQQYGEQRLQIIQDNLKHINDLTVRYTAEMARAYHDFIKAQQQADRDYAQSKLDIIQNYSDNENATEQNYYQERAKAAAAFGLEMQRLEEDHQIQMRRMQQDHTLRSRKLAEQRDALGLADEMEQYEINRQRAEEDYNKEAARKNQDFARQMAADEHNFAAQRAARKAEMDKQLAELKKHYDDQSAQRKQDYQEQAAERKHQFDADIAQTKQDGRDKLRELQNQHNQEIIDLRAAFNQRRQELGVLYDGERAILLQKQQTLLQDWKDFYDQAAAVFTQNQAGVTPSLATHKQAGGYQNTTGGVFMHAGEFVLSKSTTQAAEQAVGQKLNQQNVVGAMSRSFNPTVSISVGPVNGGDANQIGEMVQQKVHQTLIDVYEALGR